MELFILRHGDAARSASSDRERPLTGRGKDELHTVLSANQQYLTRVSRMLVSPYVRTLETGRIAAEYLPPSVVVESSSLLVPEADPSALMDYLQQLQQEQGVQSVMLVSHQPLVGVLLDRLCGFETGRYRLGTSALASVEAEVVAADLGQLRWLRQPADVF
jgi:phosphohistidine phosphatase